MRADLLAMLAVANWGLSYGFAKLAFDEWRPLAFTGTRFLAMAAIAVVVLLRQGRLHAVLSGRDRRQFALGGLCGVTLYQLGFVLGLERTSAFSSALLVAIAPYALLVPIVGGLFALIWLGEQFTVVKSVGAGLTLLGLALSRGWIPGRRGVASSSLDSPSPPGYARPPAPGGVARRWVAGGVTMRSVLVGAGVLASLLVLGGPTVAPAQLGVVNPTALPPGSPATPFGRDPHPFNNAHPAQPWSVWNRVLREFVVAARVAFVPMAVLPSGSRPATVAWQAVMLPGYRVTETNHGYVVHEHWGVEPVGNAYYWAWRPAYYVSK